MPNNKIEKYLNVTTILFAVGFIIIIVGIYFTINNVTTSGPRMGRYGINGTGTLDGKGLVFCGIIIGGFGLIFRGKNKPDKENKA